MMRTAPHTSVSPRTHELHSFSGATCNPANVVLVEADPLGCSSGVLTVCAATPSPSPLATPVPGYVRTGLYLDAACSLSANSAAFAAIGCTPTGPSSSFAVSCTSSTTYVNTTYSASASCTGPSTSAMVTAPPCFPAAGGFGLLYEGVTCVSGAYTSPASGGAKATTYYPSACTPSGAIVSEETFVVGSCAATVGGAYSEAVSCNATHLVVTG